MENLFINLNSDELLFINGGEKSLSDWLIYAGGICACFVSAPLGIIICTANFIWG